MIGQYVKLRDCIFMYSESAKQSDAAFLRLWRIAFRGFVQFGLNATWQPKTIAIPVNANKTATLPPDCIQWWKIGQADGAGGIQCLTINHDMSTYGSTDDFRLQDIGKDDWDLLNSGYWFNGYSLAGLGAATTKSYVQNGQAKVDTKNNCIVLSPDFPLSHILLEYISAPEQDDDYAIPLQFQEAMIAWLSWQDIANIPATNHIGNNTIGLRMAAFGRQLKLAKRMWKPFRLQEFAEYTRFGISAVHYIEQNIGVRAPTVIDNTPVLPACPVGVVITPDKTILVVEWNYMDDATRYGIRAYQDEDGDIPVSELVETTNIKGEIEGLVPDVPYWVRVSAFINGQYNFTCPLIATRTLAPTCPIVSIQAFIDGINVTWQAIAGATKYGVEVFDDAGGTNNPLGQFFETTSLSKNITPLDSGTDYWVRVSAYVNGAYDFTCAVVKVTTLLP